MLQPTPNRLADFCVEITDHFGLDRKDALKYQFKFPGFAKWWVAQHQKDYKPFVHRINISLKAGGNL